MQETERLFRLDQVLTIIPISKSSWWKGVREGRFPQPVKLGPRTTCWRGSDINNLIGKITRESRKGCE